MARMRRSGKPSIFLAKLSRPRLPAIVERPRLYRLLDRARKRPVIWINAPPGFGKTTLVASYLRARKIRSLWYQVDEGDRELATFFHYLGLAAKQAAPRYRTPLPHLTPEYLQGLPTFTRRFFEQLYARLKPPALLILDNYQEVPSDSLLHETVVLAIEALPQKIGVIVMSRTLPPSTFARLQATRYIHSIGEQDLRLTTAEARAIVRLHTRSTKPDKTAAVETLQDKLQGWVAGLVLQLEQAKADQGHEAIGFQETPQVIFDYLAREVIQRLSPEMQRFLMRTAFLPSMTTTMAAKLTGDASAADILAKLYESCYFTERRAETQHLYQYHPLFREFLHTRARAVLRPDEVAEIQSAAASLLENSDRVEDAVVLYAEAGQVGEIVRIILTHAAELLQQGRSQTVERWLAYVPAAYYEQEPWLFYWRASCRLPVAPLESEAIFEKAFELFKAQDNRAGMLLTLAGIISSIQFSWIDFNRFDRWLNMMQELVQPEMSFPSKEIETQVTFCILNAIMWRRPQPSLVTPWTDRAKSLLEDTSDMEMDCALVAQLGNFLTFVGDLESADKYSSILKFKGESENSPPLMRLTHYTNRAVVTWNLGNLEECMCLVEQGLALSKRTGVHAFDAALHAAGATCFLFQNSMHLAERFIQQYGPLVAHPDHLMRANHLYMCAWIMSLKGDLARAWRLLQEGLAVKGLTGSPFPEALLSYAAADLLHRLGDDQLANNYLNRVTMIANYMKSALLLFNVHLLEAQIAFDNGTDEAGRTALREALAIGKERGFSFQYWWHPKSMAHLCAKALEANIEVEYVQNLIHKTRLVPDTDLWANEAWPWPIKIYTLGRFEIHLDGTPLPPRRKAPYRVLMLLKAMIAFSGQDIPTSRLIDALWPEAEGDTGAETFHKTLQRLRRLLNHDEIVQVRGNKVSLNRQVCWVDAMAFDDLLSHRDRSDKKESDETATWIKTYEQAVQLYRGHFLDGDEIETWAQAWQDRLRRKFIDATERLRMHWTELGDSTRAMDMTRRTREVEPAEVG